MTRNQMIRKLELIEAAGRMLAEDCYEVRQELLRIDGVAPPEGAKKKRKPGLTNRQKVEFVADFRRKLLKNRNNAV